MLAGSTARLVSLLKELIELTGQPAGEAPVLELQFGDILTRTVVQEQEGQLLIVALLPKSGDSTYLAPPGAATTMLSKQQIHYLWDGDEGRHIGVRSVPVKALHDDRSVMDAILDTADQAAAWSAARQPAKPAKPA